LVHEQQSTLKVQSSISALPEGETPQDASGVDEQVVEGKVERGGPGQVHRESASSNPNTPTPTNKVLHFVTLMFSVVAIVMSGISVSSSRVPWTKLQESYKDATGFDPPPSDPDLVVIIRAGLLNYDFCYGSTVFYSAADGFPPECLNGRVVVTLVSLSIILATSTVLLLYVGRAGTQRWGATLTTFLSFALILAAWTLWRSKSGCPAAIQGEVAAPLINDVGWILAVVAWVFILIALSCQLLGACRKDTQRADDGASGDYRALLDQDIPYL